MSDANANTDEASFELPPALAARVWQILRAIQIAPLSERLGAFRRATQLIAGLTGRDFSRREAADRLSAWADCNGLFEAYDEDTVQAALAEGFENPIFPDETDEARPPAFTDEELALRFAELHAYDLRFVSAWGKWLIWNGKHWRFDDTLRAFDLARKICREAAAGCKTARVAAVLASATTVAAVVRLARADRRLAATVDQWDSDPWLFNTPGGVIDLRTGNHHGHRPGDYLTQIAAVAPAGSCPKWHLFLNQVTAGDKCLQQYLQRVAGYCLTGITNEHALFFGYGTGANGKTVFTSTISGILADYHRVAPIETFTASHQDRHPTELARLRGGRLVTAVETEEGRRWAESRIKSLTGGDKIAAHFMRQDFFEFTPQFKLLIAGNHKPGLRSVDEAIRRRFHLIPFTVTIPPADRDSDLVEKLKAEWPGILAWAIEGCLAWQSNGLAAPVAVTSATAAYLEAEDAVAAWLKERCEEDSSATASSTALFSSWKDWAEKAGEPVGSQKKLSQRLEDRGFSKDHTRRGSSFKGLRILLADQ